MSNIPINVQILNISVNLARVGNWAADSYDQKQELIKKFLDQTDFYLSNLPKDKLSANFQPTLKQFIREFELLKSLPIKENPKFWAEKALTWANILQHRAKLA